MTLLIIHGNLKRRSRRSGFHRTRKFLREHNATSGEFGEISHVRVACYRPVARDGAGGIRRRAIETNRPEGVAERFGSASMCT